MTNFDLSEVTEPDSKAAPRLDKPSPTLSARQRWHQAAAATIALLAETFPKCFSIYEGRRRPLKIGIRLDIQAALDGTITPTELHRALGVYCSNPAYLGALRKGAWRLDLDGKPVGTVTLDEEAHAKATLARIKAKKVARAAAPKVQAKTSSEMEIKRLSLADLKAAALARKHPLDKTHGGNHAQNATTRRRGRVGAREKAV